MYEAQVAFASILSMIILATLFLNHPKAAVSYGQTRLVNEIRAKPRLKSPQSVVPVYPVCPKENPGVNF